MASAAHLYTSEQISVWLRGLLTIAWADGHFDEEEKALIVSLTQDALSPTAELGALEPIAPDELAAALGNDAKTAENFLRTAVMVAIADGTYSTPEDQTLRQFCQALEQPTAVLETLCLTLPEHQAEVQATDAVAGSEDDSELAIAPLRPVREWLDQLEIADPRVAHFLCKMIPSQCPFERDVNLFGHKVVHIPPLCKLNPLYEQLVGLRFRALSYLADDCGEDVAPYC
jgi:tellurite resistance protein